MNRETYSRLVEIYDETADLKSEMLWIMEQCDHIAPNGRSAIIPASSWKEVLLGTPTVEVGKCTICGRIIK